MAATAKLLGNQLNSLRQNPVEGFLAELTDDSNMFVWTIWIEGPRDTLYEGGIFRAEMRFPPDYPMSPPTLRFVGDFWHPNVYQDGNVCISILHPPGEDAMSGELPEERWLPTQTVSSILLSVISMLGDPNFSSPANVDASVEMRRDPAAFKKRLAQIIQRTNAKVPSHVKIPHPETDEQERAMALAKMRVEDVDDDLDFYGEEDFNIDEDEEDYGYDDDEAFEDNMEEDEEQEDEEDEEPAPVPKSAPQPAPKPAGEPTEGKRESSPPSSTDSSPTTPREPAPKKRKHKADTDKSGKVEKKTKKHHHHHRHKTEKKERPSKKSQQ